MNKGNEKWHEIADEVASAVIKALPADVRGKLGNVSVTLEDRPSEEEVLDEDEYYELLGLFTGPTFAEELASVDAMPPSIRLFVENIKDIARHDVPDFRREVRKTLLHEIGHYLGLEEGELEARGL